MEPQIQFEIHVQIVLSSQAAAEVITVSPGHPSAINSDASVGARLVGNFDPFTSPRYFNDVYLVNPKTSFPRSQPMFISKHLFGDSCDRIGITAAGFSNQPDPCTKKVGTCLGGQPRSFFLNDIELDNQGQKGTYWIANSGDYRLETGDGAFNLVLPVDSGTTTQLLLNIKADSIRWVQQQSTGRILNVTIPAAVTALSGAVPARCLITNTGVSTADFLIELSCNSAVQNVPAQTHSVAPTSPLWVTFNLHYQSAQAGLINCTGTRPKHQSLKKKKKEETDLGD